MPGTRCAVFDCLNSLLKTKKDGKEVSYHQFPKDPEVRKAWADFCSRGGVWNSWNPDTSHLCSEHFREDDFVRDMKSEIFGQPGRRYLKQGAVPTLRGGIAAPQRIAPKPVVSVPPSPSPVLILVEENNELKKLGSILPRTSTAPAAKTPSAPKPISTPAATDDSSLQYKSLYFKVLLELSEKTKAYEKLELDYNNISCLVDAVNVRQTIDVYVQDRIKELLSNSGLLLPNQIDIFLKRKEKVKWNADEIKRGLTLRYLSIPACEYLQEQLSYPLPSVSYLQKWAAKVEVHHGLLMDALMAMEIYGLSLDERSKLIVLICLKVKVSSEVEYDQTNDEVLGPFSFLKVVMACSLFGSWQQPIFAEFDRKLTKGLLNRIMISLDRIGYSVVAVVFDIGRYSDIPLREIGVTFENPVFPHPVTGRGIHVFLDSRHLLSLLRYSLLTSGFTLGCGSVISNVHLKALTLRDFKGKASHNLTSAHINVSSGDNHALASELLSAKTASILSKHFPGPDNKIAKDTGRFISIISNWFEIFSTDEGKTGAKTGYGAEKEAQDTMLDCAYDIVLNMRCNKKNELLLFQKGILMNINALKLLHSSVKQQFYSANIFAKKLSVESLEKLFPSSKDPSKPITPQLALKHLKMIMLGKSLTKTKRGASDKAEEKFVFPSVLSSGGLDLKRCFQLYSAGEAVNSLPSPECLSPQLSKDQEEKVARFGQFMSQDDSSSQPVAFSQDGGTSWINRLSDKGIVEPSPEFLQKVKRMDRLFLKLSRNGLKNKKKVIVYLTKNIHKRMEGVKECVVESFVRHRLVTNMKFMNGKVLLRKSE